MAAITPQYFALGVGAAGALVDVSSLVTGTTDGVSRRYGQLDPFRDALPGTFSVVLDNYDGRFTPDNAVANAAAGYSTTVTEGMAACVQMGSRLTRGQVIGIRPLVGSNWGRIQITCDDALGVASRASAESLTEGLVAGLNPVATWLFKEPSGGFAYGFGSAVVAPFGLGGNATFGVDGFPGGPSMQVQLSAAAATSVSFTSDDGLARFGVGNYYKPPGVSTSYFTTGVGVVITPLNGSSFFEMQTDWMSDFRVGIQNGNLVWYNQVTAAYETIAPITVGEPMSVWVGDTGSGMQFYLNGSLVKTEAGAYISVQQAPVVTIGNAAYGESLVRISALIGGVNTPFNPGVGYDPDISNRIGGIATMAGITVSASTSLWEAALGPSQGGSALEMLNDVLRTEQGYAYPVTSGTLTSNTETLVIRERTRPTSVSASFDAVTELTNAPEFIRDLTNMVSSTTVVGPDLSVTVADPTLTPRVGSKNDSDYTVLAEAGDLSLWGQDRLQRGANVSLRLASLVIDSVTTPTDRSADLLALVPGDRVRVTNLPDEILGFTEWDGWIVGGDERHNPTENRFQFSLAPVLDPVPVFNDARFAAGTSLTLSSTINNSVTSISVATTDATFTTDSADLPVDIVIDSEEMTVTAVSSATPQVFTVTRGVNGTTAASHASGAQVELASVEPADDASIVVNWFLNPLFFGSSAPVNQANTTASIDTYSGSLMAKAVASSTANASMRLMPNEDRWAVSAGQFVYAAFTGYNAAAGSRTFQAVMRFYDTAGATLGTQLLAVTGGTVAIGAGASTLMSVSGTAPAFTQSVSVAFQRDATGSVGDTFYADGAVMSDQVVSPFGGDSTSSSTVLYSWAGPPNASPSYRVTQGQVQPATFGF